MQERLAGAIILMFVIRACKALLRRLDTLVGADRIRELLSRAKMPAKNDITTHCIALCIA